MCKKIFLVSLLVACLCQGVRWSVLGLVDDEQWAAQGYYVQVRDAREFDTEIAYGYPGGPVIDGTVLFHLVFRISYLAALIAFLSFFNALLIACIAVCAYAYRPDLLWIIALCGMLALNQLFIFATPPSAVAPLLIVLLCMLSLMIDAKRDLTPRWLLCAWSLVLGLSVATRIDIGVLGGAFFMFVLFRVLPWKRVLAMLGGAVVAFVVFDPFMYFVPVRHIADLFDKVHYFYAKKAPMHMDASQVWDVSWLVLACVCFGPAFMVLRKGYRSPVPPRFMLIVALFTACAYAVFLSSHIQAERYFLPVIFIWHTFLPLFMLALAPEIHFSFLKTPGEQENARRIYRLGVPVLLIGYELALFVNILILSSGGYPVKRPW